MYSVAERELMFRNLAGNPTAKRITERVLHPERYSSLMRRSST